MNDWASDVEEAVHILNVGKVPVQKRSFGFALQHADLVADFAHCGGEHDSSISMSVQVDEEPPVT